MSRYRIIAIIAFIVAFLFATAGCGFGSHKGSATLIGLRYSDSLASGGKFKGCIQPGQRITTTDNVYWLPGKGNERQDLWQSDNAQRDHSDMRVTTKDGQTFWLQLNVNFGMVDNCNALNDFMRTIGLTRGAYFKDDAHYQPGWITAMDYYISSNVIKRATAAVSHYNAADLWPTHAHWADIENQIAGDGADSLLNNVTNTTNGEQFYTIGPVNVLLLSPNTSYQQTIEERQQAKTKAETAKFNKKAQVAQAKADAAVAKAQASITRAQIGAYPSVEAYLKAQVIEKGGNPFQPSGTLITPAQ